MSLGARLALIAICTSCAAAADRSDAGDSGDPFDGGWDAGAVDDAGPTYSFTGQVAHLDGTPWGNATVGFCSSVACLTPIFSSSSGTFQEKELSPDDYVVDVLGDNSDGGSASAVYFHLRVESNLAPTSPIVLPETGPGVVLHGGIQVVQVDKSLALTVDQSALTWPNGQGNSIAGIQVPSADWPASYASDLLDGGGPGTELLAVWALKPFQAVSSTPIGVAISNTYGFSPSSHAKLFGINVATGMPADAVELEVAEDGGVLMTLPGQGVTELTWLLLVSED